ncbi:MAG: hypothetical protein CMJ52_08600 [Planctomycetaceae bacterium]|nr:hypothetical protein [Planctomycetaceae bacterium]
MPETILVGSRAVNSIAFIDRVHAVGRTLSLAILSTAALWCSSGAGASSSSSSPDITLPAIDSIRQGTIEGARPGIALRGFAGSGPLALRLTRDLEALDLLLRDERSSEARPRVNGFGRVSGIDDPARGTLGVGGVDLDWRPSRTLSVAVVAGGRIDRSRAFELQPTDVPSSLDLEREDRKRPNLASRSSAFDGLAFGGESAAEANPFVADRVFSTPSAARGLESNFLATRAIFRPADGSSFGIIATRGGGVTGDASLLGFDLDQRIAGQRVQAWVQHAMGDGPEEGRDADRSAVGASIDGDLGGVKYGVAWRRLGEDFDSGLGRTGDAGTHAITGRMGWSLPLEGMPFIKSWEFGVRTRFDTDLQFESRNMDLSIDAARLRTVTGDRISFGIDQRIRTAPPTLENEFTDRRERFRVGIDTNPGRPFQFGGSIAFGDPIGVVETSWRGGARWKAAPGLDFSGEIAIDRRVDGIAAGETLRTAVNSRARIASDTTIAARLGFDAARERVSMGQEIGFRIARNARLSMRLDQDLVIPGNADARPVFRASVRGSFDF